MALSSYALGPVTGLATGGKIPEGIEKGIESFWTGRPAMTKRFPRFDEGQEAGISQILQQALGGLSNNNFSFEPIEAKARQNLQENTIPGIAERFASFGQGARSSGAYQAALGKAGSDLETNLAALKSQYGLQQQGLLQNLLGLGLTPKFETAYFPEKSGFFGGLAEGAAPAIGELLTKLLPMLLGL